MQIEKTVYIDLDEIDTEDLIKELESRDIIPNSELITELITEIFHKRRLNQDYQPDLDRLIYEQIGRIG